jgi:hypothetical protein
VRYLNLARQQVSAGVCARAVIDRLAAPTSGRPHLGRLRNGGARRICLAAAARLAARLAGWPLFSAGAAAGDLERD